MDLIIKKLANNDEAPMDLLLLADPSREMVEEYLKKGAVYTASLKNKVIGVYILVKTSPKVVELKNIAVNEEYQGQGIGKRLVLDAIEKAKSMGAKSIEIGTGNSSLSQLALYQKCGFRIVGVDKDFFTRNYSEPIMENGIKCVDMVKLSFQVSVD